MLKFALVGCGRIAKRHADILGRGRVGNAKLTAVADTNEGRAKLFAQEYGVPSFSDPHQMMREMKDSIDVICILTPSGLHAVNCTELSKYGKHIVVEKPMALTLHDADAMIESCKSAGVKLFVVKQNRYNLPVQKLYTAIEEKRFGKLVLGAVRVRWCRPQDYYDQDAWRGTWTLDGGVFSNQASHHIDLLEWMMGPVESVFAKASTALVDIEAEDTGVAVMRFRNGALGVVEATTATRPKDLEGSISILGEFGSVEIGGFAVNQMKTWSFSTVSPDDADVLEKFRENPPSVYGFGHERYLEHVVDCLINNKTALVDGLEGRKSLELISAIYESIETGKEVWLGSKQHSSRLGSC